MVYGSLQVPDPRFPFLGVHFTPRMDGSVWLGPNAILAFKREGYSWSDFDLKDFTDSIRYRGFQRLALKYAGFGLGEMLRSAFISLQLKELQKYIPNIGLSDISRYVTQNRSSSLNLIRLCVQTYQHLPICIFCILLVYIIHLSSSLLYFFFNCMTHVRLLLLLSIYSYFSRIQNS